MLKIGSFVVILASVMHYAWGIALFSAPLRTTGIGLVLDLCRSNHVAAGLVFVIAGLLATISTWSVFDRAILHVLLLMPQQFLLFVSAAGAMECIALSRFADGTQRPWDFIFVDQVYLILLCIMHAISILVGYGMRQVVRFE